MEFAKKGTCLKELEEELILCEEWERRIELGIDLEGKSVQDWKKLRTVKNILNRIEFVQKPKYSSGFVEDQIKVKVLEDEMDKIKIEECSKIDINSIHEYRAGLLKKEEAENRLSKLQKELTDTKTGNITQREIDEMKNEMVSLREKMDESTFSLRMRKKKENLDEKMENMNRRETTLIKLKELKKYLCETESRVLEKRHISD